MQTGALAHTDFSPGMAMAPAEVRIGRARSTDSKCAAAFPREPF
jgi:hypothetical protein